MSLYLVGRLRGRDVYKGTSSVDIIQIVNIFNQSKGSMNPEAGLFLTTLKQLKFVMNLIMAATVRFGPSHPFGAEFVYISNNVSFRM